MLLAGASYTPTSETLRKTVIVRQFGEGNNWILAGVDPELDARNIQNASEMKNEAEQLTLHRMATVHNFLDMWRGSQSNVLPRRNITLKTSRSQPWDTCQTRKRLLKHPDHSLTIMVHLNLNFQNDLFCHHLCLQWTTVEDVLKY
jgi:hypothetical protein